MIRQVAIYMGLNLVAKEQLHHHGQIFLLIKESVMAAEFDTLWN
jgi:uncharacterized damage-inducible protein DinB